MGKFKNIFKPVKKVGKKVKKTALVTKAAGQLGARMMNPYNLGKMGINALRGKGLVLPGSRYIGPGNSLNAGTPTSSADAAARLHDLDYDNYLKHGVKAKKLYFGFSDADARLMKRSDVTTPDGLATYSGMLLKKVGHKIGLTGKRIHDPKPSLSFTQQKALRTSRQVF
jgi:hypothetical protein